MCIRDRNRDGINCVMAMKPKAIEEKTLKTILRIPLLSSINELNFELEKRSNCRSTFRYARRSHDSTDTKRRGAANSKDAKEPHMSSVLKILEQKSKNFHSPISPNRKLAKLKLRKGDAEISFEELYEILVSAEKIRQSVKKMVSVARVGIGEQKAAAGCYEMVKTLLRLPFNRVGFQLKGYKLLGDLFVFFKDYRVALLYYMPVSYTHLTLPTICSV
eukprot:TRINITY_DN16498_c0_g1_i1.p1 TRINITY_DN16498_c0_g1~~TRINITY_DN16498_c0_g1_i1.p1  ORF type:complete len:218 (+),score=44.91 TRINITY_DN16498_c0_g1_i1:83-736(+)